MSIKTIIGQVARGENYFPRPNITDHIWDKLDSGSNLLLVAPRRVGKSSILNQLLDNPRKNYIVIYFISESVNNENEFYKKLYHHLVEKLSVIQKYKAKAFSLTKDLVSRIESFGKDGIGIGESKISYLNEFQNLIKNINWGEDKILVLIDEFAQTVENIIQDVDFKTAIHFLESKREIRQTREIQNKLQFVYAGSIGLENIVSKINSINTINDLTSIEIPPLNKKEAAQLVQKIIDDSGIILDDKAFDYLVEIIEWLIPFYFQLILDESYKLIVDHEPKNLTQKIIDTAVENALKHRIYFEQWFTRLRKAYKSEEFSFVKELLNLISESQTIKSNEILDLAEKYKLADTFKELINALKYDGYINNNDDPKVYRFNSPLLRKWWYCNVAN